MIIYGCYGHFLGKYFLIYYKSSFYFKYIINFSLIPLLFEFLSILSSLLYYKNFTMDNEKKGN